MVPWAIVAATLRTEAIHEHELLRRSHTQRRGSLTGVIDVEISWCRYGSGCCYCSRLKDRLGQHGELAEAVVFLFRFPSSVYEALLPPEVEEGCWLLDLIRLSLDG